MPRGRLMLLVLICGHIGPLIALARPVEQPAVKADGLRLGLTTKQVRDSLGTPTHISRRVILYRTQEQWHYARPRVRLSFDQPQGSPAVLVRISGRDLEP